MLKRKFLGIDIEKEYLDISKCRKLELENEIISNKYKNKLQGFGKDGELELNLLREPKVEYNIEFDFE